MSLASELKNRHHFVLAPLFDWTVFSAHNNLLKLKNEKNNPKLSEIALSFVRIRYNRPELRICQFYAICTLCR